MNEPWHRQPPCFIDLLGAAFSPMSGGRKPADDDYPMLNQGQK
jgi:hypothetical protein